MSDKVDFASCDVVLVNMDTTAALVREVVRLRAALRDYGECKPSCERMCGDNRPCSCEYVKLVEDKP